MTEAEWLASVDWLSLWHFARERDLLTFRKRRLLAVAACRELEHSVGDNRLLRMVALAEEWADATTEPDDGWWNRRENWCDEAAMAAQEMPDAMGQTVAWVYVGLGNDEQKVGRVLESVAWVYGCPAMITGVRPSHCPQVSRLIREAVGNPFRSVPFDARWRPADAVAIARRMYDARDFSAMPILSDALMDAGCDNEDILAHCRSDGPHCRGCWVVDLVLGKE